MIESEIAVRLRSRRQGLASEGDGRVVAETAGGVVGSAERRGAEDSAQRLARRRRVEA
jgi:hypothetical protein